MKAWRITPADAERARARLELGLRSYRVEFLPARPGVERAAFPSLVGLYWDLTGPVGALPPTQEVFATHVYSLAGIGDPAGVRARAYKAWTALVRQHHFELVLRARFPLVLRGESLDQDGLDFVLIESGAAFGVALSVKTPQAQEWAAVKRRRHPVPAGLPLLELSLDLDDCQMLPTAPRPLALHWPSQAEDIATWIGEVRSERREAILREAREQYQVDSQESGPSRARAAPRTRGPR